MTSTEFVARYSAFEAQQKVLADTAFNALGVDSRYVESYIRLTSFQAWGEYLFKGTMPSLVFAFYIEAQNDGLISHLLARQGMWRPSLQSLRSLIENILVCHYYLDHPVELELWKMGKHRTGFAELLSYFEAHPSFRDVITQDLTGLSLLKAEYGELSKAVHGSSASFMMGDEEKMPNVYVGTAQSLGQWLTRQTKTVEGLNLFMTTFHRARLLGTGYPALRKAIANAISVSSGTKVKAKYGVTLQR